MKPKSSLTFILIIGIAGLIFSGYLSYYNLWGGGCREAIISCGANPITIFGLPTCVYGFFMYLIVTVLSIIALKKENKKSFLKAILWFGIAGLLFSGFLSYRELFLEGTEFTSLPACVYGFIMYLGIVIFTIIGLRYQAESRADNNIV